MRLSAGSGLTACGPLVLRLAESVADPRSTSEWPPQGQATLVQEGLLR